MLLSTHPADIPIKRISEPLRIAFGDVSRLLVLLALIALSAAIPARADADKCHAVALARTLHEALAFSGTALKSAPAPSANAKIDLDTAAIDKALGGSGKIAGGVYQVNVPRAETPKEHGMDLPPPMGTAQAINFQPTGKGRAAI